jgi:ribosome-associated protein
MEVEAINGARTLGAAHAAPDAIRQAAGAAGAESEATGRRTLDLVTAQLADDKADDVVVIELAAKSTMADYMVIASGRSTRQVGAMADHLREKLKAAGLSDIAVEGQARCDWVLVDGGDVIVHLFRPEVRTFYNLEKMWGGPAIADPGDDDPSSENVLT